LLQSQSSREAHAATSDAAIIASAMSAAPQELAKSCPSMAKIIDSMSRPMYRCSGRRPPLEIVDQTVGALKEINSDYAMPMHCNPRLHGRNARRFRSLAIAR
jgi:hypothetical protein